MASTAQSAMVKPPRTWKQAIDAIVPISMHDAHMHVDLMHAWSTHVARDSR